ncbi:MAG TPA: hypothetical protein VMD53_14450 [Rhizomicrobium sp.]|nr:hypothetical protein [Rhizomicrobium sp.]
MSRTLRPVMLAALILPILAGCSSDKENNCPGVSSVVETSIATIFKPNAPIDPSNILYTVEITQVQGSCDVDKTAINSSTDVNVSFRATRPPNGAAATYKVPYFVAISQFDRILAKKVYSVEFHFEPGQTETTFSDTIQSADVSAGKDKKTFDYLVLIGLQLTKAQLDYNRASGRLNP